MKDNWQLRGIQWYYLSLLFERSSLLSFCNIAMDGGNVLILKVYYLKLVWKLRFNIFYLGISSSLVSFLKINYQLSFKYNAVKCVSFHTDGEILRMVPESSSSGQFVVFPFDNSSLTKFKNSIKIILEWADHKSIATTDLSVISYLGQ